MQLESLWYVFWVGFAGGVAAEVVRWFLRIRSRIEARLDGNQAAPPPLNSVKWYEWATYAILGLVLSVVGGLLAIAYPVRNIIGALHVGASVPVFFTAGTREMKNISSK